MLWCYLWNSNERQWRLMFWLKLECETISTVCCVTQICVERISLYLSSLMLHMMSSFQLTKIMATSFSVSSSHSSSGLWKICTHARRKVITNFTSINHNTSIATVFTLQISLWDMSCLLLVLCEDGIFLWEVCPRVWIFGNVTIPCDAIRFRFLGVRSDSESRQIAPIYCVPNHSS